MKKCTHYLSCLFFSVLLIGMSLTTTAQVLINEFSASNVNDLTDNYGNYEDWIELYNAGSTDVNLEGYYLSDRLTNPTKWQIPADVTIPAGGHLLFWASKRDEVTFFDRHTNFKITQTKASEDIVLSDPTGTVIDWHEINEATQRNHSWGRTSDGAATWSLYGNSTPNAANTNPKLGYTPTPVFSIPAGLYTGASVLVSLSCADPSANIFYTTNGNNPTSFSTPYTGPITVSNTTVIKAVAYATTSDYLPSFIETNTYFLEEAHVVSIISIAGNQVDDLLNGSGGLEPEGTFEYFDANGIFIDEATGDFNRHGNDSWAYDQRGFDYIVRDQLGYNHAIQDQIFPNKTRTEFQRLILKAAANDNYPFEDGAYIRDAYVHQLSQNADLRLDERTNKACVLYVNGEYWGVYEIREKVDDHDFTKYYYNQGEEDIDFLKTWGGTWAEYGSRDDWDALFNFIITNDMTDPANYDYVKSELNTGSLIDYMIINTQSVCMDWLNWNTAWWRGKNPDGTKKKWRYILWDMDATFGHYINYTDIPDTGPEADPCNTDDLWTGEDFEGHTEMLTRLLENETFYTDYINRWADLNNTYFSCDYMLGLLDEMIAVIEPEMPRQIARWGGGGNSMADWQSKVDELRDFISARCTVINEGIDDCYDVEGPYIIAVSVEPPGSGQVEINDNVFPDAYPWIGEYFGGVNIELDGDPNEGYSFLYWTVNNNIVTPDTLAEHIFLNLTDNDVIVAHFGTGEVDITIEVAPIETGDVVVDGVTLDTYPWTGTFMSGLAFDIEALAAEGFEFDYWESTDVSIGDPNEPNTNFVAGATDGTIILHFKPITYDITFVVEPVGGGEIDINGTVITTFPHTQTFGYNELVNLEALAAESFEFANWESAELILDDPNAPITAFTANADGTITLYLETITYDLTVTTDPANIGSQVNINGDLTDVFPFTSTYDWGTTIDLAALAPEGYILDYWELSNHTVTDPNAENITFDILDNETVIAHFSPLAVDVTIVIENGGGTVTLDGTTIENTWTGTFNYGDEISLEALEALGFQFDSWTSSTGDPLDSTTDLTVTVTNNTTITVSFIEKTFPITFDVSPAGSGNINLTDILLSGYPVTNDYQEGTSLNFAAVALPGFRFVGWQTDTHSLGQGSASVEASLTVMDEDVITAIFEAVPPDCTPKVPSAFSPNEDGKNDLFRGIYQCPISDFSLKIFNRWGEIIFETNDPTDAWDGRASSGDMHDMGVYVWVMTYTTFNPSGELEADQLSGNVTIVR